MGEDAYLLSEVWSSVRALIWGTYKSMIVYLRKHQLSFSEMDVKSRGYLQKGMECSTYRYSLTYS